MQRPHEIDRFEDYIEREEVRGEEPDPSQARSLLDRSESKFMTMEKLGIEEDTSTDYVENVYESCKMMIQSHMAFKGYKPYNHESIIAYAIDRLELGMINSNTLNKYRKLRNDISYRGEIATKDEAENIKQLYEELKSNLKPRIKEKLR